jgi:pyruvate dehydrogenase E2 component (dihydrolipoamide acetyltransferase)
VSATTIGMPRLSDSMEEGTVLRWLKQDGDELARGEELVEIETDKATMVYEAESAGVLRRLVAEGETVPLGQPIAELLAPGQAVEPVAPAAAAPAAAPEIVRPAAPAPANGAARGAGRIAASPVARRLAAELGIDLASLTGSGPRGRVVKRDVEAAEALPPAHVATAPPAEAPPPRPAAVESAKGAVEEIPLTRIQATVARRMAESRATVPDFEVSVDVVADALVALREQLRGVGDGPVPSYNDFIVKACAVALRAHPRVNGAYRDGHLERYGRVNVGVAVAAEDALLVPVVTDADEKSIGTIARETRRLSERARESGLTAAELSGGTFTVSNLGMFGVTRFSAVVNQPQAAILAVGALEQRPVVRDGAVVPAHVMTLTLCADHRILYGADAATFLAAVKTALEEPLRLLL